MFRGIGLTGTFTTRPLLPAAMSLLAGYSPYPLIGARALAALTRYYASAPRADQTSSASLVAACRFGKFRLFSTLTSLR